MIQEFKDFINRGNVLDLAVAFVLGVAFVPVITTFVDGILMQIVAAIVGEPDFSSLDFDLGDANIQYGQWLTAVINFVLIAFAIFLVVKAYNSMKGPEDEDAGPSEVDLLTEIRDSLASR